MAGGCKVVAIYAKRLQDLGHDVIVIAPNPHRTRSGVRGLVNRVRAKIGPPQPTPDRTNHLELLGAPYRLLDDARPVEEQDVPDADVIIATWWQTAEWIRDFPARKGAKAYFIQHYEIFMANQPLDRVNATWRLPYHKITISRWLNELANEMGDNDVTLVLNGVDMEQFHASPRGKAAVPTIGFLYAAAGFKGVDVAVKAIEKVHAALPNLRVVSFGISPPSAEVPIPAYVNFTRDPNQSSIRDFYAQCDVWLCASRGEGFHLPPLEAMACRCPVVSTRVGGPLDIVDNGVNGYLVDVGDADALADRLLRVLNLSDSDWTRLSNAAFTTAQALNWERATEQFLSGLESAIAKGTTEARP